MCARWKCLMIVKENISSVSMMMYNCLNGLSGDARHFQPQLNDSKQRESLMYQRVVSLAATKSLLPTDKL